MRVTTWTPKLPEEQWEQFWLCFCDTWERKYQEENDFPHFSVHFHFCFVHFSGVRTISTSSCSYLEATTVKTKNDTKNNLKKPQTNPMFSVTAKLANLHRLTMVKYALFTSKIPAFDAPSLPTIYWTVCSTGGSNLVLAPILIDVYIHRFQTITYIT